MPPGPADAIGYGDVLSGAIDARGKRDLYVFDGQAGEVISVAAAETFQAGTPRVRIFAPSGAVVANLLAGQRVLQTLSESGTYAVLVRARDRVSTGGYNVSLVSVQPPNPVDATITRGDVIAAAIDAPTETDLYTFTGDPGDVVSLAIAETSGFLGDDKAEATVYSPTGAAIATVLSNGSIVVTLPDAGTYTILVSANAPLSGTGSCCETHPETLTRAREDTGCRKYCHCSQYAGAPGRDRVATRPPGHGPLPGALDSGRLVGCETELETLSHTCEDTGCRKYCHCSQYARAPGRDRFATRPPRPLGPTPGALDRPAVRPPRDTNARVRLHWLPKVLPLFAVRPGGTGSREGPPALGPTPGTLSTAVRPNRRLHWGAA